jgi:hypothetical protein
LAASVSSPRAYLPVRYGVKGQDGLTLVIVGR